MRPVLKPALRRLWRDESTLQLGIDPQRAVVLAGVGRGEAQLLAALDGALDEAGVRRAADLLGVPADSAVRLLELLAAGDTLDDASANTALAGLHADERERLAPDRASLSLTHRGPGAADRVLTNRRRCAVRVVGGGRIGAPVATLLAAAGVGTVVVDDPAACRHADAAPGGLTRDQVGLPRDRAATANVQRAARETVTTTRAGRTPELTVLTGEPNSLAEQTALLRAQLPHLIAAIRETTGVVGPLVLPGTSACAHCLDLARSDRDRGWPRLAAQLATRRERSGDPCDVVLATLVAAQTAAQALGYLDRAVTGGPAPATVNGTLEVAFPDWRWRRRGWTAHPACGCCWTQSA
ncbi:MAG: ThiF family adenylyltransferase [Actinomycetes bacterium]